MNLNKSILNKLCLTIIDFSYNLVSGISLSARINNGKTEIGVSNIIDQAAKKYHHSVDSAYNSGFNINPNNIYNLFIPEILKNLNIKTPLRRNKDIVYNPRNSESLVPKNTFNEIITLTAALANSIYHEIKSKNDEWNYLLHSFDLPGKDKLLYKELNKSKLLLIKCELTDYKNYVFSNVDYFTISTAKYSSSYLSLLTKVIEKYCLNCLKLTDASILFKNSSSLCLLLPFSFKDKFEKCKVHINSVLAAAFNGNVYFSNYSEIINPCEIDNLSCKWNKLIRQLGLNYSNQFADIDYKNIFKPFSNSNKNFLWFNKKQSWFDNKEIRLKWNNNEHSIHSTYNTPFNVFSSFGYANTKSGGKYGSPRHYIINNSESNILTNNALDLNSQHNNLALVEISIANPNVLFKEIKHDLDLFTIIKYYSTFNSEISNLLGSYINNSNRNRKYSRWNSEIIYSVDGDYILICELDHALKLSKDLIATLIPLSKQKLRIPFLISITPFNNEQMALEKIQSSQKYFIDGNLKEKYYNKIFLFIEEFSWEEFVKLIEFVDLFIDLIIEKDIGINNARLILKTIYKSSLFFNKLSQNSEDGYLYFEEIWKLKYQLACLDCISDEKINKLIKIYEDTLISNLIRKTKFNNKMILAVACKIADLLIIKAKSEKQPLTNLSG